MASEITPTTKVNIGILGTLLAGGGWCVLYLSNLSATVAGLGVEFRGGFASMKEQLTEIKAELRDGSAATAILNRDVATLVAKFEAMEKRLNALEAKSR